VKISCSPGVEEHSRVLLLRTSGVSITCETVSPSNLLVIFCLRLNKFESLICLILSFLNAQRISPPTVVLKLGCTLELHMKL
jgi:hypothetical protein